MRMGYGLNLEQAQKLILTPELKQAISILQLSSLELAAYVERELLENPVLELKEEDKEDHEPVEQLEETEMDWQEYFDDGRDLGLPRGEREIREAHSLETYVTQAPTLLEHLNLQLELLKLTEEEEEIGYYLIGNINDNGYLEISVEEAARHLGCSAQEVNRILKMIQNFEPAGVGARDLTECLLIQLRAKGIYDPLVEAVITRHLEDLAQGKWQKIAKTLRVSPAKVQEIADLIKTLDPKPGRQYSQDGQPRYIVPDVVVEKVDGEYVVLVNDHAASHLRISPHYQSLLTGKRECDEDTLRFLEQKLNAAHWVLRSIEQRRLTLYRVVNAIIYFQRDFFEKGVKALKPLTLKQVADFLGIHKSTVSRATAHKYVQTPLGVFDLKFFFASGVEQDNGLSASSQSVKMVLQELIEAEDARRPYTDQQLVQLLKQRGISISRRTVTKYRDELGIPAAAKRKRY